MMSNGTGWLYVAAVLIPLAAFAVQLFFGGILRERNAHVATGAIAASCLLSLVGFFSYLASSGGMPAPHHGESHGGEAVHASRIGSLGIGSDLAALTDDPKATLGSWARGERRQVLKNLSIATDQGQVLTAGKMTMTRPLMGGGPATVNARLTGTGTLKMVLTSTGQVATIDHAGDDQAEAPHAVADHGPSSASGPLAWTGRFDWVALSGGHGLPSLKLPILIHVDNLTAIVFVMVTLVATLIHLFSIGYMHGDPRYPLFFTYLSLFCFSMLGLVLAGSVFLVFIFWELVGVCSYLLIGFWYEEKKNCDAANKAFITNRVGDLGMLLGLGLIWSYFGTFSIDEINKGLRGGDGVLHVVSADGEPQVELRSRASGEAVTSPIDGAPRRIPYWLLTVAGLGIFAGCVGKSAQFPLHVWLPDAMAGPTPVSALIHAATMVAAGVYLVGRFFPLFTYDVLVYIAYTGGITALIGASIAVVQNDYKKVLAYSTVSQLGFMMLGLGVGGWAAGLFHLITHAFFKALLFLGAGSVYHAVHTYEMPVLGGLRKKMPITATTMLVATMAISGVPGLSGFYSKDAILASALNFAKAHPEHILLFLLPAFVAALTAFYMFRMWFLLFTGTSRSAHIAHEPAHGHGAAAQIAPGLPIPEVGHGPVDPGHGLDVPEPPHDAHGQAVTGALQAHGHVHDAVHGDPVAHAHESPPIMAWPLIALAVPTVAVGWPLFLLPLTGEPILEGWLSYGSLKPLPDLHAEHVPAFLASLVIAALGIGLAVLYYGPWPQYRLFSAERTSKAVQPLTTFLRNKWYFDELYGALFVRPILALSRGVSLFDRYVVDGLVNALAWVTVRLSDLEGLFDRLGVDGLVNLVAQATYALGEQGRRIQTGRLRSYLMFLSAAVVLMFLGVFAWVRLG